MKGFVKMHNISTLLHQHMYLVGLMYNYTHGFMSDGNFYSTIAFG